MDHESRFECSRDLVEGGGVENGGTGEGEAVADDRRKGMMYRCSCRYGGFTRIIRSLLLSVL